MIQILLEKIDVGSGMLYLHLILASEDNDSHKLILCQGVKKTTLCSVWYISDITKSRGIVRSASISNSQGRKRSAKI